MERIELKTRKDQKIVGIYEKPQGKIVGTCVVQHGWGGNKERPTTQAAKDGFLEIGFQTFNFDATNTFGESDGDYEKSTLGLHWEDFEDVVKWVKEQEWFVPPLALTGHSKGGYSVLRYAEEYPDEVVFVAPIAPVVSGKLSFEQYEAKHPGGLEEWKRKEVIEELSKQGHVKRKHWFQMEERLNHDLLPKAKNLTMPVFLVVGSEDDSCPSQHIKILFDAIPEGNKKMEVIQGAPHSFYLPAEVQTCKRIIKDWIASYVS